MSASVSVAESNPLPDHLKQTQGPSLDVEDVDCPICREPMDASSPTLECLKCARRFDTECLTTWIESAESSESEQPPNCPNCRASWKTLQEIEEDDRAVAFRNERREREDPQVYYAMGDPQRIAKLLISFDVGVPEAELLTAIRDELTRTDDMIEILGSEELELSRDIFDIKEILRRQTSFNLTEKSLQYLWTMSRIFGVNLWYIARISLEDRIGFFMPIIPGVTVHTDEQSLVLADFCPADSAEFPSSTIQMPLPTYFVLDYLRARDVDSSGRFSRELRRIELANEVTHWLVSDTHRDEMGTIEIDIIPWPRGSVFEGLRNLIYPGWPETDTPSTRNGWDEDVDTKKCEAAVNWQMTFLAGYMERMWTEERQVAEERRIAAARNAQTTASSQVPLSSSGDTNDDSSDADEADGADGNEADRDTTSESSNEDRTDDGSDDGTELDRNEEGQGIIQEEESNGDAFPRPAWTQDDETEDDERVDGDFTGEDESVVAPELEDDEGEASPVLVTPHQNTSVVQPSDRAASMEDHSSTARVKEIINEIKTHNAEVVQSLRAAQEVLDQRSQHSAQASNEEGANHPSPEPAYGASVLPSEFDYGESLCYSNRIGFDTDLDTEMLDALDALCSDVMDTSEG